MMEPVMQLQELMEGCERIVFFGGAGVSTASGIPDYRSRDGIYGESWPFPPERMLSRSFFEAHPGEFYRFYRQRLLAPDALPNGAHKKLAELEQAGKLLGVVTQNVDGLHQKAGSKRVWELHGSIYRNYCVDCIKYYDIGIILEGEGVPRCSCGGIVRPDVVLYEEGLDAQVVARATAAIREADMLIVGGTSLQVYPAAGFLDLFSGRYRVIINRTPTPRDREADLVLDDDIAEVMGRIRVVGS